MSFHDFFLLNVIKFDFLNSGVGTGAKTGALRKAEPSQRLVHIFNLRLGLLCDFEALLAL